MQVTEEALHLLSPSMNSNDNASGGFFKDYYYLF